MGPPRRGRWAGLAKRDAHQLLLLRPGRGGTTRGFRSDRGSFSHASYFSRCSGLSKNNQGGGAPLPPFSTILLIAATASDSGQGKSSLKRTSASKRTM